MKPAYGIAPLPSPADTQPRSDAPAIDRARRIPAPLRGLAPMPRGPAAEALVQAGARESGRLLAPENTPDIGSPACTRRAARWRSGSGALAGLWAVCLALLLGAPQAFAHEGHDHAADAAPPADRDVIRTPDAPLKHGAGFIVLSGNFFDSAIMKMSVVGDAFRQTYLAEPGAENTFDARAIVFDGPEDYRARIDDPQAGVLVVKRYNLKNIWHAFGRSWRPSRAWHSWREGHRLRFYGIATPEPLALVEERFGPLRRRAFLVNAFCPGRDLLEILSADAEPPAEIAAALLALFGTLHALRISHGDFKATNLLWHDGQVVLIDLDAMTQHRSSRTHAQAWRRDRARFLRNWPAGSPLVRWLDARLPLP